MVNTKSDPCGGCQGNRRGKGKNYCFDTRVVAFNVDGPLEGPAT